MIPTRFVLKQLLLFVPVLMGVASFVFSILHLSPDGPALTIADERINEESARQVEKSLGLNDPIWMQYEWFFVGTAQFQFDESFIIQWNTMVRKVLADRLPVMPELVLYGWLIGTSLGIPLGILSAAEQDSTTDHLTRIGALAGISVSIFWSGPLPILLFAQVLGWLPTSGRILMLYNIGATRVMGLVTAGTLLADNWDVFVSAVHHVILPTSVIGTYSVALISRMMRSSMLEVIRQDYMRTARVKDRGTRITALKHGPRNAMILVIAVVDIQFGGLLGGAVLTEAVFAIGDIRTLLVEAIKVGDYPIIQGTVLTFAFLFTLVNLDVSTTYSILGPWVEQ